MIEAAAVDSTRATLHTPVQQEHTYLTSVARAADGPAPTLVVDLREASGAGVYEDAAVKLALCREDAMAHDSRLGAKTIGLIDLAGSDLRLLFLQGLGTAIDPLSEVCLNSAVVAVEVACAKWRLVPLGRVTVHMGDFVIELEPVA